MVPSTGQNKFRTVWLKEVKTNILLRLKIVCRARQDGNPSSLNSRGFGKPTECERALGTMLHAEGVPFQCRWGDPIRVDVLGASALPSVGAPMAYLRLLIGRPRCGLIDFVPSARLYFQSDSTYFFDLCG